MTDNVKYYLSFDCATKTFAYILVKINYQHLFVNTSELKKALNYIKDCITAGNMSDDIMTMLNKIDNNTKYAITILSGDCVDLIPNIANKDIDTVERIKLVSSYVKQSVLPLIEHIPISDVSVLVEFQMSHNTQSKVVSIALLALFSDYELCLVNPSLKNKLYFTDVGKYSNFAEKYKTRYDANKKHALYNFMEYERVFEQSINISKTLKGHIADSFMQILGHIAYPFNRPIKN